jgi:hemoglobin
MENDSELDLYSKYRLDLEDIIGTFYRKVMDDPKLARFFADIDINRQIGHMVSFIATALGGPDNYQGRTIKQAHSGLGISEIEFSSVADRLRESLFEHGVKAGDIDTVMGIVASLKSDVVDLK